MSLHTGSNHKHRQHTPIFAELDSFDVDEVVEDPGGVTVEEVIHEGFNSGVAAGDDWVAGDGDGGVGHDPVLQDVLHVSGVDVVGPLFDHPSDSLDGFFFTASWWADRTAA